MHLNDFLHRGVHRLSVNWNPVKVKHGKVVRGQVGNGAPARHQNVLII
jgi:hypothetical protein